jgi:hypothetical protein
MSVDVKRIERPAKGVDGRWKMVTHAADQVTGYGRIRGVK